VLQPIQFLLQRWPWSSKVDDFHLIWKGIYNFLLVININFGPNTHRFRDMARFLLKNAYFSYPQILFMESFRTLQLLPHVLLLTHDATAEASSTSKFPSSGWGGGGISAPHIRPSHPHKLCVAIPHYPIINTEILCMTVSFKNQTHD